MRNMLAAVVFILVLGLISCSSGEPTVPMGGQTGQVSSAVPGGKENPSIFWADPQVIQSCDDDLGQTTLYWKVPGANKVEIHVGEPKGSLFSVSGPEGSKETQNWVRDGMVFYLMDSGSGEILATCKVSVTKAGCPGA